jgi:hypothetical protein
MDSAGYCKGSPVTQPIHALGLGTVRVIDAAQSPEKIQYSQIPH